MLLLPFVGNLAGNGMVDAAVVIGHVIKDRMVAVTGASCVSGAGGASGTDGRSVKSDANDFSNHIDGKWKHPSNLLCWNLGTGNQQRTPNNGTKKVATSQKLCSISQLSQLVSGSIMRD